MTSARRGWPWRQRDVMSGLLIYAGGDTVAALILGQFSLTRLLLMAAVGALLYSVEVPAWFRLIDRRVPLDGTMRTALQRTLLALLYFNPLWIARHLLFIKLGQPEWQQIEWALLTTAGLSFLGNIPLSFAGNLFIQNRVSARHRFIASALFSALIAVYYALSAEWFG